MATGKGESRTPCFRNKSMPCGRLHAPGLAAQNVEAAIGRKVLRRLLVLDRPRLVAIDR